MVHTYDSFATRRRQGAVSKEVALLLTELSKLWCSPELSAEDAQTRANNLRSKLGLVAETIGHEPNHEAHFPWVQSKWSCSLLRMWSNVHVHQIFTGRMPPMILQECFDSSPPTLKVPS